jgi:hypothetical protein
MKPVKGLSRSNLSPYGSRNRNTMQQEIQPFHSHLKSAFRAANASFTPMSLVRSAIDAIVVVGAACVAMRITGLEPFVVAFCNAHGWLMLRTLAVYIALWPLFCLLGQSVLALFKGFAGVHKKPEPADT